MQKRVKTIIERHGFNDEDRKGTTHDQIQIWAYRNINAILKDLFPEKMVNDPAITLEFEYVISDKNYVVGFADLYCVRYSIGIEIKTRIASLGDLVRQIQFYKKYAPGIWIVISPDDRFASLLKAQDINFYKYKNPDELF